MNFQQSFSYRLALFLAVSGLCATLLGCVNKAQPNFARPPAPVVVSTAVSQDVSNYMDSLGKIVARETVSIQPQVSGRIVTIHFADGANVPPDRRYTESYVYMPRGVALSRHWTPGDTIAPS